MTLRSLKEQVHDLADVTAEVFDDDLLRKVAEHQYRYYRALLNAGFTEDQAALIVTHNEMKVEIER